MTFEQRNISYLNNIVRTLETLANTGEAFIVSPNKDDLIKATEQMRLLGYKPTPYNKIDGKHAIRIKSYQTK